MKCINCEQDIPARSRFCMMCGAEQPDNKNGEVAASSNPPVNSKLVLPSPEEFDWVSREEALRPDLDYEAQRRFDGLPGRAISCVSYVGFFVVGLLALIPGVPLMALLGLPAALILGLMTWFNIAKLQERWRRIDFLKKLPGFSGGAFILSLSVTFYLAAISGVCILLMRGLR